MKAGIVEQLRKIDSISDETLSYVAEFYKSIGVKKGKTFFTETVQDSDVYTDPDRSTLILVG